MQGYRQHYTSHPSSPASPLRPSLNSDRNSLVFSCIVNRLLQHTPLARPNTRGLSNLLHICNATVHPITYARYNPPYTHLEFRALMMAPNKQTNKQQHENKRGANYARESRYRLKCCALQRYCIGFICMCCLGRCC